MSKWWLMWRFFSTATSWRQHSTIFYWIIKKMYVQDWVKWLLTKCSYKQLLIIKNSSETFIAIISLKRFIQVRQRICNCGLNNNHRKTILDLLESSFSAVSDELIISKKSIPTFGWLWQQWTHIYNPNPNPNSDHNPKLTLTITPH